MAEKIMEKKAEEAKAGGEKANGGEAKEAVSAPVIVPEAKIVEVPEKIPTTREEIALGKWVPKTQLGRDVFEGKIKDIREIFKSGKRIIEPEIVDRLVPELKNELLLIGGRAGKGGGAQRIPVRITAAMHKSVRRFSYSAFAVVGDENGLVGIGKGGAPEGRDAIAKAIQKAKLNLISIKRGCGSWECGCGTEHSVPYKVTSKSGSVRVELLPAPKGVGLVADDESKKLLKIAGIRDVWIKTFGNTGMRINLITAVFKALKKLYTYER